jgi:glycosyltransferase involved in cell wall biosynthesis
MVMVEALSAGKPVVACREGGAPDVVRTGETGILVEAPTVEAIRAALDHLALAGTHFEPARLQAHARTFDRGVFERRFLEIVERAWQRTEGRA